jgi:hypothetical protein
LTLSINDTGNVTGIVTDKRIMTYNRSNVNKF